MGLISYVNAYKITITLPSCQLSKPTAMLENNIINYLYLPSNNNKEDISLRASTYGKKRMRLASNNNEDIRPANID